MMIAISDNSATNVLIDRNSIIPLSRAVRTVRLRRRTDRTSILRVVSRRCNDGISLSVEHMYSCHL
jgi:beta-lactamase class A